MAGSSQRRGAVKKSAKGNPTAGSGGRRRKGLEGKGPTPKAVDRPYHKAHKAAKAAQKRAAQRPKRNTSGDTEWAAGRNSVLELLRAEVPVTTLYVAEGAERDDRLREVFKLAAEQHIAVMETGRFELDKLTNGAVHQGLAAKMPAYEYAHPDDFIQIAADEGVPPLIVLLDGVTDPRNLGAVIRSAAAFGAHGVVIPERRSAQMTASAWKTAAGAAARVPVARATNVTRQIKAYQNAGLMVIGLAANGEVELPELDFADGPLVVVVGGEGKGISRLVSESCDQLVAIPIAKTVESLNAGVAAGIALYAIDQKRR